MKRLILLLCLLVLGCPQDSGNGDDVEAQTRSSPDTARQRLLKALDEGDNKTLNRGEVAKAWRAVTDEEWESWDTNGDDVLDRGEIGEMGR